MEKSRARTRSLTKIGELRDRLSRCGLGHLSIRLAESPPPPMFKPEHDVANRDGSHMNRVSPSAIARGFAVAVVAFAALAPSALAATPAANSGPCAARSFSTIFSSFGDNALYTLAPDGGLEAGAAGWMLGTGASVARESSSIKLDGKVGARSLELASGASATTPAICVERGYPSFRFVARSLISGKGAVRVEVMYGADRKVMTAGTVTPGSAWGVSPILKLVEGQYKVNVGESGVVQFRFTASGGTVRMDDVYVDPRYRG
jgi:hypothetical protein